MSTHAKQICKLFDQREKEIVSILAERFGFNVEDATACLQTSSKSQAKPKRPASAYIRFCQAKRPAVKAEQPDWSSKEILTELGRLWKAASEDEKKPFVAEYEKAKAEST